MGNNKMKFKLEFSPKVYSTDPEMQKYRRDEAIKAFLRYICLHLEDEDHTYADIYGGYGTWSIDSKAN